MCGRYTLTTPPEAMRAIFNYENIPNLQPRFNIAPTQPIVTIRYLGNEKRVLLEARWGLIPSWAKDSGAASRMINARAETLLDKPSFKEAFGKRRCLIPADGFYEWRLEEGRKQPFRIGLRGGGIFAFAGLWESWKAKHDVGDFVAGDIIETATIITTKANKKLRPIHHRMPVIIPAELYSSWLDPANDVSDLKEYLKPYPSEPMAFYRVDTSVNNIRNDHPSCIEPLNAVSKKSGVKS